MNTRSGNLITLAQEGHFDVIIHGCNCFCTMGAGIAKAIKAAFPAAYEADLQTEKGSRDKLGTYTSATLTLEKGHTLTVINAYTQHHYRGRGVKVDYDAIAQVMQRIASDYPTQRIGYPRIGAGLAGGDWDRISNLIDEAFEGLDHTLVVLPP